MGILFFGFIFVPFYMLTIYTHLIPSSIHEGFKHTCNTEIDLVQGWEIGCNGRKSSGPSPTQDLMLGSVFAPVLPGGQNEEGNISYEIHTVLRSRAA